MALDTDWNEYADVDSCGYPVMVDLESGSGDKPSTIMPVHVVRVLQQADASWPAILSDYFEAFSEEWGVAKSGGATISRYTATCTDGTTDYTGTSSTSRITVSGLTNGVGYSCSVTATNAAGTSTPSASSPPLTPEEFIATGLPIWLLHEASK